MLVVRFWGVRGSIATPGATHQRYGGNTACVEIRPNGAGVPIILDGGTGLRELGAVLAARPVTPDPIPIFLSHFHWDHISGIPFFAPLYDARRAVRFHATARWGPPAGVLSAQMQPPYFSVTMQTARAAKEFVELGEQALVAVHGAVVTPFALNHPHGALGFRVESGGVVVVYATDFEPGDAASDAALRTHAHGADLLICDAQFTPEEYEQRRGWGHGTWQEATRLAQEAQVKQLVLFHHDPARTDDQMDAIADQARTRFANTVAAREGLQITLGS